MVDFYSLPRGLGLVVALLQRRRLLGGAGKGTGAQGNGLLVEEGGAGGSEGLGGAGEDGASAGEEELLVWQCASKRQSTLVNRICWHPAEDAAACGVGVGGSGLMQ